MFTVKRIFNKRLLSISSCRLSKPIDKNSNNKEKKSLNEQIAGKLDEVKDSKQKSKYYNEKTGEIGGPQGPEPTRYGDWERKGRVSDF
uniref:Succinate dehydrogenase assembly factor 4, mitochondrial n=1 Tax=Strongyloides venezuelensis TaxID=75913 RepID=A0A0K0FGL6_STRVS